jgi:hypothetical protein
MPDPCSTAGETTSGQPGARRFRPISYVTGDVSPDGGTVLLRIETERDGEVDLSFPTVDLQHLVTLLLILGGKAAGRGRFAAFSETFQPVPLPLHGVSIGLENDKDGVLTVEIGAAVLSFSLSRHSMAEIGRAILTLSASASAAGA